MKTIGSLLADGQEPAHQFLIPAYQRGYRWTKQQVEQLLDDIASFEKTTAAPFYCLQPVVVRWREAERATALPAGWELIDGQQRLTTIWLILQTMGRAADAYHFDFATTTRNAVGKDTLAQAARRETAIQEKDSLEASYLKSAARYINKWYEKNATKAAALTENLTANTQIIWYQTAETADEKAQAIFTRLNAGKISLTNAELIKALLLKRPISDGKQGAYGTHQFEIAADWDWIEAELGRPELWGWLRCPAVADGRPRIEWLLQLVQETDKKGAGQYALFQAVEQTLQTELPWDYWQRVKNRFLTLRGWFDDNDLYHRVGYLLATDSTVPQLLDLTKHEKDGADPKMRKDQSQTAFRAALAAKITERAGFDADGDPDTEWDHLQYSPEHNGLLKKILLLHNVATAWQARSTNGRFPFDRYFAEDGWSLEHIHPQNPKEEPLANPEAWLTDRLAFLEGLPAETQLHELIGKLIGGLRAAQTAYATTRDAAALATTVEPLQLEYLNLFSDFDQQTTPADTAATAASTAPDPRHALANLALLAGRDNTSLSNGAFPEKRAKLLDWHHAGGRFVPPATLNVFLKMYSRQSFDLLNWSKEDRADYQESIRQSVLAFLQTSTIVRYAHV